MCPSRRSVAFFSNSLELEISSVTTLESPWDEVASLLALGCVVFRLCFATLLP